MTENILRQPIKLAEFLAKSEEKTIKRFMGIAGLSNEYEASLPPVDVYKFSDRWKAKKVRQLFSEAGYSIEEQQLKNGADGVMVWRMTLIYSGSEICYQDIEIHMKSLWGCNNG